MAKQIIASKAILQYLTDHGRVRTERLREAICEPPPKGRGICTPKMFYKYLADLWKSHRITKFEESRNVVYYSKPDWVEYQNRIADSAVKGCRNIESQLGQLVPIPSGPASQAILTVNTHILHNVFTDIMDLFIWATLTKLRNDPKESSLAVDGILTGTFPDLIEMFSRKIEKFEKYRPEIIEELQLMQRKVVETVDKLKQEARQEAIRYLQDSHQL